MNISTILNNSIDLRPIMSPIQQAFEQWFMPITMAIVIIVFSFYIVKRAMALSRAEDENQRVQAKKALATTVISLFLVFIGIVLIRLLVPALSDWVGSFDWNWN